MARRSVLQRAPPGEHGFPRGGAAGLAAPDFVAGAFRRLLGLLRGIEEERLRAVHRFLAAARAEEEREADAATLEAGLGAAGPERSKALELATLEAAARAPEAVTGCPVGRPLPKG